MATQTAPRPRAARTRAPLAYRLANFLVCSVLSWVILLGIATIEDAELRRIVAACIAVLSTVIGVWFERTVDRACYRAARNEVDTMLSEVRH